MSNPRGYDDKSLVKASVSRLARWGPITVSGVRTELSRDRESIWKGNAPRPADNVDICEPVDIPSVRLSGGDGNGEDGSLDLSSADCGSANGERGATRTGRSDMGEGGTKWKDSRIESAFVEVVDRTDPLETLLLS